MGIAIVLLPQLIEFNEPIVPHLYGMGLEVLFFMGIPAIMAALVLVPCVNLTLVQNRRLAWLAPLLTSGIVLYILATVRVQSRLRWILPFYILVVFVVVTMLALLVVRFLGFRLVSKK